MPTPFPSRQADPQIQPTDTPIEWRCTRCGKLLGLYRDGRLHLRFARGHEYFVGFPAVASCRGCGTLNRTTAPMR